MTLFDSETAKGAGKRSGEARRRKARDRLTPDRLLEEFGPLETVDDAMRRLDRINTWIVAGLLSGSAGSAACRALEIWLRGQETKLTQQVVVELKDRLEELEGQLKHQRMGVVR